MKLKELVEVAQWRAPMEIANPIDYFYGYPEDVPQELMNLEVAYIGVGYPDSPGHKGDGIILLVDAEVTEND